MSDGVAKVKEPVVAPFMTPRGVAKAEDSGLKPFEINRLPYMDLVCGCARARLYARTHPRAFWPPAVSAVRCPTARARRRRSSRRRTS